MRRCCAGLRAVPRMLSRCGGFWRWQRLDGGSRTQAAAGGGVTLEVVRDWVPRFNADGPDGLIDRKAPGKPSLLSDAHRAALAAMVEHGPIPAVHGVVRWRIIDLCQWIREESRSRISKQTLSRELRGMGFVS